VPSLQGGVMASWQRKRGGTVRLYPRKLITDNRGNNQYITDMDAEPIVVTFSQRWIRSSRAEVPGQQTIDVRRIIVPATVPYEYVSVWAVAVFGGDDGEDRWDIIAPPQYHQGTRHVRHWSIDLRRRPDTLNG